MHICSAFLLSRAAILDPALLFRTGLKLWETLASLYRNVHAEDIVVSEGAYSEEPLGKGCKMDRQPSLHVPFARKTCSWSMEQGQPTCP